MPGRSACCSRDYSSPVRQKGQRFSLISAIVCSSVFFFRWLFEPCQNSVFAMTIAFLGSSHCGYTKRAYIFARNFIKQELHQLLIAHGADPVNVGFRGIAFDIHAYSLPFPALQRPTFVLSFVHFDHKMT